MHGWRYEQEAAGLMVICRSVLPCSFLCSDPLREENDSLLSQRRENFFKAQNRREPEAMSLLSRPPPHSACMGGILVYSEKYLVQG